MLLAAHRARESDDRTVLSRQLTVLHAVRGRQVRAVRALDGGGGSRSSSDKLPREKVEAEAAAKPSMRSSRVTRSTASTDPDGACCKPAVEARPCPAQSLHTGALTPPMVAAGLMSWRLLHSLAPSPGTRLQRNVGPPPRRSPSRRSQVVVGQRWWRQIPRGSSSRSSLQSIAMGRRAQCPPSIRRMPVRRARPSRIAAVSNRAVDGSLLRHHHLHALVAPTSLSIHLLTSSAVSSPLAHLRCHRLSSTDTPPLLAGCVRVLTRPLGLGQVPTW